MPKYIAKCLEWFRPTQSALILLHTEAIRWFIVSIAKTASRLQKKFSPTLLFWSILLLVFSKFIPHIIYIRNWRVGFTDIDLHNFVALKERWVFSFLFSDCEGGSCKGTIIYGGLVKEGKTRNSNGPAVQNEVPCARRVDSAVDSPCIVSKRLYVLSRHIQPYLNSYLEFFRAYPLTWS